MCLLPLSVPESIWVWLSSKIHPTSFQLLSLIPSYTHSQRSPGLSPPPNPVLSHVPQFMEIHPPFPATQIEPSHPPFQCSCLLSLFLLQHHFPQLPLQILLGLRLAPFWPQPCTRSLCELPGLFQKPLLSVWCALHISTRQTSLNINQHVLGHFIRFYDNSHWAEG